MAGILKNIGKIFASEGASKAGSVLGQVIKGGGSSALWSGVRKRAMIGAGIGAVYGGVRESSQGGSFIGGALRGGMSGALIGGGSRIAGNIFRRGAWDSAVSAAKAGNTLPIGLDAAKDIWRFGSKDIIKRAATGAVIGGVAGGVKSSSEGGGFLSGALSGAVTGGLIGGATGFTRSYRAYNGAARGIGTVMGKPGGWVGKDYAYHPKGPGGLGQVMGTPGGWHGKNYAYRPGVSRAVNAHMKTGIPVQGYNPINLR